MHNLTIKTIGILELAVITGQRRTIEYLVDLPSIETRINTDFFDDILEESVKNGLWSTLTGALAEKDEKKLTLMMENAIKFKAWDVCHRLRPFVNIIPSETIEKLLFKVRIAQEANDMIKAIGRVACAISRKEILNKTTAVA